MIHLPPSWFLESFNYQPIRYQYCIALLVSTKQVQAIEVLPGVLPVREDALLEDGVVSTHGKSARHLDVVVQTPEVLHSGHRDDGSLVLFPGARLVILEEPQGPRVLKNVGLTNCINHHNCSPEEDV